MYFPTGRSAAGHQWVALPSRRWLAVALAVLAAVLAAVGGLVLTGCAAPQNAEAQPVAELTGDFFTHDPALVAGEDGQPWFVYSTGNGEVADGNIQLRRSSDGVNWEYAGEVWQEKPAWLTVAVPGVDNLWAPELYQHDGTWYLYYSASTFGKNLSVIALATNTTLDPADPAYEWVDQGQVISSKGERFNAIDPAIAEDGNGTPWMTFGSFWTGLQMVELEWPTGLRAGTEQPLTIADRKAPPNAIEAPYLLPHDGAFYLFFSRDFCCQGLESTYNIAVGKSDKITGPYLDGNGVPLLKGGGGTPLLGSDGGRVGPGGQSISGNTLAFHYYAKDLDGAFRLGLAELEWKDGWPAVSWGNVR
ncbi:arabinan endo-1,5-alpha-L-arabinosidase [Arthrobacter sp. ISL-48]|uniref:arabinan endo-1,5-alpha-L-arabinosidase n=1 Tax=Arthrobacter sp. ISL-48 TaxID=2819110 RepID=UPI001BE56B01|nr:arabinan endo-1,5-alpha-L-arabinosidase [Arthrobacter sp. ISL-48]MBT2533375.1 arabinan endo-1,5-alpha-L-arabinosidase [Arthrobacter sp. ISL-48]